jgi:hypothetical protein
MLRLNDRPGVFMASVEIEDGLDRLLGVRRVLHVHARETVALGGVIQYLFEVRPAKFFVEIQSEGGEFDGDSGVEVFGGNPIEGEFIFAERLHRL